MIGRCIHHDTMTDLQVVKSTISSTLSSLLNTWASVTEPYIDMNLTASLR